MYLILALGITLIALSLYPTQGDRIFNEATHPLADDHYYSTKVELGWPFHNTYTIRRTTIESGFCSIDCGVSTYYPYSNVEDTYTVGFGLVLLVSGFVLVGSLPYTYIRRAHARR